MCKKWITMVLCICLGVTLLAGCGKKYSDPTKDVDEEEDTENTLVYWSTWEEGDPQADVISDAVESFTKETGIKAKVEFKGDIGIKDGLLSALNNKTRIDLMDEDMDQLNVLLKDQLLELSDLAAESKYEDTAHAVLMRAARAAGDGKLMTIPIQPEMTVIYYNRQIFEEAGIKEEPVTWEDFLAVCEKIKKAGYIPFTSDDYYDTSLLGYHLARLRGSAGTEQIVDDDDWSDSAVLKFAKDYEQLKKKGYISPYAGTNIYPEGEKTEAAGGDAAMYLAKSSMPTEVRSIVDDKFTWGCFNYPELKDGRTGTETAMITSKAFGIPKSSKMSKEAFRLIEYLTKGEYDQKLAEETSGIPVDTANEEWPEEIASVKPVFENVTTRLTWAAGLEDKNDELTEKIKSCYSKLVSGQLNAKGFVAQMKQSVSKAGEN